MMSSTTFSAPMGFLEAGGDVDGILAGVRRSTKYFALVCFRPSTSMKIEQQNTKHSPQVGQIPSLDFFFDKNPLSKIRLSSQSPAVTTSFNRIVARMSESDGVSSITQNDFLNQYLKEKAQSEQVDVGQVLGWLLLNVRVRLGDCLSHSSNTIR